MNFRCVDYFSSLGHHSLANVSVLYGLYITHNHIMLSVRDSISNQYQTNFQYADQLAKEILCKP